MDHEAKSRQEVLCSSAQSGRPRAQLNDPCAKQPSLGSVSSTAHPKASHEVWGSLSPGAWGQGEEPEGLKSMAVGIGGGWREAAKRRGTVESAMNSVPVSFCRSPWLPPARPSPCLLHKELLRRGRTNAALCGSRGGSGFVPDSCL